MERDEGREDVAVTSQPGVRRGIRHLRTQGVCRWNSRPGSTTPVPGKHGVWRWLPSWRQLLAVAGIGFLGISFGLFPGLQSAPRCRSRTRTRRSRRPSSTGGSREDPHPGIGRFGDIDRHIVAGQKIKQHVKDAVVAAEDRSFWSNRGISPTGILRAAWNNVRGGSLQGGSTITQQYVKNAFLDSQERTLNRKSKEFFVSVKVARDVDKDRILENYLNTIYFGRRAYGIDAAAQAYFYKGAAKLSVSEAAFLAGIINGPELYDPDDGGEAKARARVRWNYVLDGMVEMGTLDASRRPTAFPRVKKQRSNNSLGGQRGYLMDMVRNELRSQYGLDEKTIDTGGLVIRATFDEELVNAGARAVRDTLPGRGGPAGYRWPWPRSTCAPARSRRSTAAPTTSPDDSGTPRPATGPRPGPPSNPLR
jgi:membrane peptidoglycan carboxypeptidase